MKTLKPLSLSAAATKRLWHRSLLYLYLPVLFAAFTHLLIYPLLTTGVYFLARRSVPLKALLIDRFATKLLFGFVSASFVFLAVWHNFENEIARLSISVCYAIGVLFVTRRLERLAHMVWKNIRSSYHV